MSNNISPYQQTIDDLELRRTRCLEEVQKIDAAITSLRATMELSLHVTPGPTAVAVHPVSAVEVQQEARQRYANMSVRWAILKFLYEHSAQPQRSADISDALLAGGCEKASRPTVSAVISDMSRKRNEVMLDAESGGYKITVIGQSAWGAIAHSARYQNRTDNANAQ